MLVAVEEHGELSQTDGRKRGWAHAKKLEIDAIDGL